MTKAGAYFDSLEIREPAAREREQFAALREIAALAKAKAPGWARILDGVDPAGLGDRAALAALRVTRKSGLVSLQAAAMPFGGLITSDAGALARIYVSPGPIYDPEGRRP